MHGSDTPTDSPNVDTLTWAQRLAQRCTAQDAALETAKEAEGWTPNAVSVLWAMFDEAVEQANGALEYSGAEERIALHRTTREYRLSLVGPTGEERQIAVFASLTQIGGRTSGGAQITTSHTRATIILLASLHSGEIEWIISATNTPFTEQVIGDLFLSVFSYDPVASTRLSPYWSLDD